MALLFVLALSLPALGHDMRLVVGSVAALLAGLVFINLGVLLPGLLTTLGGHHGDTRGGYVEFGPAAAPLISDPASPRAASLQLNPDPQPVTPPHLWQRVSGSVISHLTPPAHIIRR